MASAGEPALKVRLFGKLDVELGGQPLPAKAWPRHKTQDLFKILISEPGKIFTLDQLVELLFPGQDPDSAAKNVYNRISELRHVLEPNLEQGSDSDFILHSKPSNYHFNLDGAVWLDTREFEKRAQEARLLEKAGEWDEALQIYQESSRIYRDDFLIEDQYEDWTIPFREEFQGLYLRVLEGMAECNARLGHYAEAILCCERILQKSHLREEVFRMKMRYQYLNGDRANALRTFEECRKALEEHLDIAPANETVELLDQIREGSTSSLHNAYPARRSNLETARVKEIDHQQTAISSVAVLPFQNMSPDPDNEYFSDGITEELINVLAQVKELLVPARTSVFTFKGKNDDVRKIGAQLDVSAVLEGSVRKNKDKVRVSAQLINVADGYHLWSQNFDRSIEDIIAVQDEIAQSIVNTLIEENHIACDTTLKRAIPTKSEAYDLYLLGIFHKNKRSKEGFFKAIEYFKQSVSIDQDFAPAFAAMASTHVGLTMLSDLSPDECFPKALEYVERALCLDEDLAEAHFTLTNIRRRYERDIDGAVMASQRAIELAPNSVSAQLQYGNLMSETNRWKEAWPHYETAWRLDPLNLIALTHAGQVLSCLGRFADAKRKFDKALELYPDNVQVHHRIGTYLYFAKDLEGAIEVLTRCLSVDPSFRPQIVYFDLALVFLAKADYESAADAFGESQAAGLLARSFEAPYFYAYRGILHHRMGNFDEADEDLEQLLEFPEKRRYAYALALFHFGISKNDEGFSWLERAFEQKDSLIDLQVVPLLDRVRDDHRYIELVRRIGFPD